MTRRVLFITQTAHVWGGLEVWLDEIVPWLRTRDWDPVVALARGRRFNDPEAYRAAHPSFETVTIDGFPATREARVKAVRRTIRGVRPDVVIPINIADTLEAVAREKLSGSNVRLLVMLRAILPHGEVEDYRRWRAFIDLAVGGNRLRARLIAAWTGIAEERIRFIPTGARRGAAGFSAPESIGGLKPAAPLRIAYIGRLEEDEKRATDLIGVANALDRLRVAYDLRIAGDGPARARLEEALRHRATFLGKVSVDELYASVFPSLDALLLFSTAEAGPQVVWQAMHYGVVPVVSEYRGLRAEKVLREGETALIFPVGDPGRAALQLERLAEDRRLRARIGANAQQAIEPDYLLDHAFESWRRALDDACTMPLAAGSSLPALASSGLLERMRMPPGVAYALRRALRRSPEVRNSGDEWPHHGPIDAAAFSAIDRLMTELDR